MIPAAQVVWVRLPTGLPAEARDSILDGAVRRLAAANGIGWVDRNNDSRPQDIAENCTRWVLIWRAG